MTAHTDLLHDLPAHVSIRALVRTDLPAVHELLVAYERRVLGEALIDLEDLEADWERPSYLAARDSVGIWEGDALVAFGEVYRARRAEICIHPEAWGRGIGAALADWSVRLVREQDGDRVGQSVPDADGAAASLFRSRGYEPMWTSWVLGLPPEAAIVDPPLPRGYAIRRYRPGHDDRAAYQVVEDAFGEWPDRDPSSYDDWAAGVLGRPGFEPWQLLLAVSADSAAQDGAGRVVGACHLVISGDGCWVNQLAVAGGHRGRGLGRSLLAAAFAAGRAHGALRAELSTDSRTGALGLYEHLGMAVTSAFTHWAREV